jgi:hypothetical protein
MGMSGSVGDAEGEGAGADTAADSGASIGDEHHDWIASTFGVDPRSYDSGMTSEDAASTVDSSGQTAAASEGESSGVSGGLLGALSSAASSVSDAVDGAVSSVESAAHSAETVVSDVADAVSSTAGDVASGVVGTVEQAASDVSDDAAKVAGAAAQSAGNALDSVEGAASKAGDALADGASLGSVVDLMVQSVVDAGANVAHDLVDATPLPDALKDAAGTYVNFEKGVAEGVYGGLKGMAQGAMAAANLVDGADLAKGVTGLALSAAGSREGDKLLDDVKSDVATDVASVEFMAKMSNPLGQAQMAQDAVEGGVKAYGEGHLAEYLGKGTGQIGVLVAAAVLGGEAGEAVEVPPEDTPPGSGGGDGPGGGGGDGPGGGGGDGPGGGGGDDPPGGGDDPPGGGDDPPGGGDDPPDPGPRQPLKPDTAKNMLGEAVNRAKSAPPAARAAQFEADVADIMANSTERGGWSAKRVNAPDGGTLFVGGAGRTVVFDPAGNMYVGDIQNPAQFDLRNGFQPNYPELKPIR